MKQKIVIVDPVNTTIHSLMTANDCFVKIVTAIDHCDTMSNNTLMATLQRIYDCPLTVPAAPTIYERDNVTIIIGRHAVREPDAGHPPLQY